ncbi:MAG TPA: toast rack family protein [Verrucomicrobiae bacterium]|nr:toast rack family protein [Verrucomicrobiae bacterium]
MTQPGVPRHRSFVGPIILIALGIFILLVNMYPEFDPWPFIRYWPILLILIGLGKIWDSYYSRQHPERPAAPWISGTEIAWIVLLLLFVAAFWHARHWHRWNGYDSWDQRRHGEFHASQTVDVQGAKSVAADIQFPAGRLELEGGSGKLLDADFGWYGERPTVDYSVNDGRGQLNINGKSNFTPFGNTDNDWSLRFANDTPIDFNFSIGAGESYLRLGGLNVARLNINMGAGKLDLDLTGPRKSDLDATIEGGVGSAVVRLPRDVGVRVDATGGIGSINSDGLRHEDGAYENDVWGKTPTKIDMTIHGGVGSINLIGQ